MELPRKGIKVEIYGTAYLVKGHDDPEYVQRLSEYVDRKMREIIQKASILSPSKVAILAALNIADELFQVRAELKNSLKTKEEEIEKRLSELIKRIEGEIGP